MSDSLSNDPSQDRDTRSKRSAGGTGFTDIESATSMREAKALEGLLRQIGQDCCKEPLQYLERTQVRQQGE
jgi:hypothetical protein